MEYITTKEASAKWGITPTRITVLATEGRIPGAQRLGRSWLIPASATKPQEYKSKQLSSIKEKAKENSSFSFPLYHFRPDWSYIKVDQLSKQQQLLISAESAVLECRFEDAYPILKDILYHPSNIVTEIAALWNIGICCLGLNKPEEFSDIFLSLQLLFSEDFPHREDLVVILDILKTYVDTMSSVSKNERNYENIHEQSIPLACLQISYSQLCKEVMKPRSGNTASLELILRFLNNTSAVVAVEMLHCHLLGIYFLREDMKAAEIHAKKAVKIAFENNYLFPLVSYYRFCAPILSSILEEYPEDFQKHCNELFTQYDNNFSAFYSALEEYPVLSKLTDKDFPYLYAVLMNLPNAAIAEKMNITTQSVKNRLEAIYKVLGVNDKKELKGYLEKHL